MDRNGFTRYSRPTSPDALRALWTGEPLPPTPPKAKAPQPTRFGKRRAS
jgi:hypothetical protein